MTTLTLAYRPVTFGDVVGQGHVKPILKAMVRQQNPPPALIFGGSRGTGKTTSARILAAALNCEASWELKGDACGKCPSCMAVQRTGSISVLEVDAASNTGVDDIRKIKDICGYATDGTWRVVLLDEAHMLSKQGQNALLKTLEEPPPQTVFVLLTTEAEKILETVRSRSMAFEFRRLTAADILGRLKMIVEAESIEASPELLVEIASRVQGGMRDAVMMLDQVRRVGVSTVQGFSELFGIYDVSTELFSAAVDGDFVAGLRVVDEHFYRVGDAAGMASDLVGLVRDLLVVRSGGTPGRPEREQDECRALAARVDQAGLVAVIKVLWELKRQVRAVDNDQRAAMAMAFVLISEALHPSTRQAAKPMQVDEGKKLSFADMAALAGA